jgi:predicted DNA-binding transcriptional regulator AlpA
MVSRPASTLVYLAASPAAHPAHDPAVTGQSSEEAGAEASPMTWREPLITTRDLATLWGQTPRWVLRMVNEFGLPHYRLGGARRYRSSETEAWLQERRGVVEIRRAA